MSSRLDGEEKHAKKSSRSEYDGEIKIDHSEKKPIPEPSKVVPAEIPHPPKPVETKQPVDVPKTNPEPSAEIPESPVVEENGQDTSSSVLVPGGVKEITISPANYFSSKYKKHSPSHRTQQPQVVFGSTSPPPAPPVSYSQASKPSNAVFKNKIILISVVALVPILGVVSYIFGIYIPNKPENTYATAMERTGKGLQSILEQTTQSSFIDKASSGLINGELQYIEADEPASGVIEGEYSKESLTLTVNASSVSAGGESKQYGVELLSSRSSSELYPAVYLKANDYKLLQLDQVIPNAASYKNKWLEIDGTYASSISDRFVSNILGLSADAEAEAELTKLPFDSEELSNFRNALILPLREHMFNPDPEVGVFGAPSFISEEEIEGIEAYRYGVSINLDTADALCASLGNDVAATSAYQKILGPSASSLDGSENDTQQACSENWLKLSQTSQAEIWIDKNRKVIHKIRFSDQSNPESYREFGQLQASDEVRFFTKRVNNEKQTSQLFVFGIDLRTAALNFRTEIVDQSGEAVRSSNLVLVTTPLETNPVISPPEGAVNLKRSLSQSGLKSGSNIFNP